MIRQSVLIISSLALFGCSLASTTINGAEPVLKFAKLPREKPHVIVEDLTTEARTIISSAVSRNLQTMDREALKQRARDRLLERDVDGNGLSLSDLQYSDRQQAAKRQIQDVAQLFRIDLNTDGEITEKELLFFLKANQVGFEKRKQSYLARNPGKRYSREQQHDSEALDLAIKFKNADKNGNNRVTLKEAYRASVRQPRYHSNHRDFRAFEKIKPLDFNNDGLVTPSEVDMAVDLFLAEAAQLGIKISSNTIIPKSNSDSNGINNLTSPDRCNFLMPTSGTQVIRLSTTGGNQLSNVALAGQDAETTTSQIRIEPGDKSLYIIASSIGSHIWRFTGSLERVERVVLSSSAKDPYGQPAVGQIGVSREQTVISSENCVSPIFRRIPDNMQGSAMKLSTAFGNREGTHFSFRRVAGINLPSGSEYEIPLGRPDYLKAPGRADVAAAWELLIRSKPSGVFEFDPKSVVTSSMVERYQTLPHEAGITQLLVSGALAAGLEGGFVVRKPFRFPSGGHSKIFIIPDGAPMPSGDPAYSCIRKSFRAVGVRAGQRC